jgi:hypothetical protein
MGDLDDAHERLLQAAGRALVAVGNDLLGRATLLTPLELGTLEESGEITFLSGTTRHRDIDSAVQDALSRGADATVDVEVSFNTPYAARQHEELTWRHPLRGQAKYLETPLKQQAARYESVLARSIALEMRR